MKNQARKAQAAAAPPSEDAPHQTVSLFPFDADHELWPDEPVVKPLPSAVAIASAGSARRRRKKPPHRPCCTGGSIAMSTG